ncbi:dixin-like isoform X1 [Rhopilema esculentum]|uniref:dixin-like isoform X1 n=2 Tax=Rhopilema esculentum TaxID=499914 RepID=UPI0031DC62A9
MSLQPEEERQMQAYIQWVNSQLRKRPGSRAVKDLQHDMKDGVALLQLIEVVGNEQIPIIENPITISDMATNVTYVLKFMAERRIKMHQINSKEIIEGNKRAIMRLILALAAHFKPGSVRPANSEAPSGRLERASSTMSLAAEAAVALADASQLASSAGLSLHYKYKKRPNFDSNLSTSDHSLHQLPVEASHSRSSSSASSTSHKSAGSANRLNSSVPGSSSKKRYNDLTPVRKSLGQCVSDTDHLSSLETSMRQHHQAITKYLSDDQSYRTLPRKMKVGSSKSEGNSRRSSRPSSANSSTSIDDHVLAEEHDHMVVDVQALKEYLLDLQCILLNGEDSQDGNNNNSNETENEHFFQESSLHDQVVILKARLDQANQDYQNLKNSAAALKEDAIRLQGEKVGLQGRLTELEEANINLRADQLRQELACDSARSAKESAQRIIEEREHRIAELHEELAKKDQVIRDQEREIQQLIDTVTGRENTEADRDTQLNLRESIKHNIRDQIEQLTGRLEELSGSENQIHSQIDHYNRRLKKIEDSLRKSNNPKEVAKEYDKASNTLENLRSSFGKHDPRQHALDSIGQSLGSIMEKLTVSRTTSRNDAAMKLSEKRSSRGKLTPRNRLKNSETHSKTDLSGSYLNGSMDSATPVTQEGKRTKVLYFINQSVTPYLASINKSLGEITLKDFKNLLDRGGSHRYYFKSMDPDFGSVREELSADDEILPGWDGKIVSWVDDDKELALGSDTRTVNTSTPKNTNNSYFVQKDMV